MLRLALPSARLAIVSSLSSTRLAIVSTLAFTRFAVVSTLTSTRLASIPTLSFDRLGFQLALPLEIFGNRLRKVDVDATIINKHVVHFDVGRLALLRLQTTRSRAHSKKDERTNRFEFDERVLKRLLRAPLAYNLALDYVAEASENDLEILVGCRRIQLAHEKHVVGRPLVDVVNVADHFENLRRIFDVSIGDLPLNFSRRLVNILVNLLIERNFVHNLQACANMQMPKKQTPKKPHLDELAAWRRRASWIFESFWIGKWIVENERMRDSKIGQKLDNKHKNAFAHRMSLNGSLALLTSVALSASIVSIPSVIRPNTQCLPSK